MKLNQTIHSQFLKKSPGSSRKERLRHILDELLVIVAMLGNESQATTLTEEISKQWHPHSLIFFNDHHFTVQSAPIFYTVYMNK